MGNIHRVRPRKTRHNFQKATKNHEMVVWPFFFLFYQKNGAHLAVQSKRVRFGLLLSFFPFELQIATSRGLLPLRLNRATQPYTQKNNAHHW